jgi:DNA-binding SARP family transcriptional activator/TolB-like protein
VEASVGERVEVPVESDQRRLAGTSLEVKLLGPLTISRDGATRPLPTSRKVRAVIGYLALASQPVSRSQLCELLWDVPNDPRGELRWCLSKVRSIVEEPGVQRVDARGDGVRLDLTGCVVDAIEVSRAVNDGIESAAPERLRALVAHFTGEFLEGLEIDRNPAFNNWLNAQRRRFRSYHAALLEQLVTSAPENDTFRYLDKWLELAPFDRRAHEILLDSLARHGRIREGEEHLEATARLFEAEGLDLGPIRDMWRKARTQSDAPPPVQIVTPVVSAVPGASSLDVVMAAPRRASIAVMPFVDRGKATDLRGGSRDGLAHDVITRLAKLRTLFVIAQGTVFSLAERNIGPEEAGRMLNVDYIVSGSLHRQGKRLTVSVELAETCTARVVWTEVFDQKLDDTFLVLDEIGNRIVASIASEIETIERNRAILRPPNSLDAWEAHHRGLWHMYRFTRADNERARHFFETAVRLDPTFARAYAGLSFTHFQDAFQGWGKRKTEIDRALDAAGQSLLVDGRDPAAHWAMGRALWLRGDHPQSIVELEQAIDLSPNFALGHYTLGFVLSQDGNAGAAIKSCDYARELSPFDPMLFGMLGARAMALVRLGRFDEAAEWGIKAATRPNSFPHISAIAGYSLVLAGRLDEARTYLASIHKTAPDYCIDDFLTAMQFSAEGEALFRKAAKLIVIE